MELDQNTGSDRSVHQVEREMTVLCDTISNLSDLVTAIEKVFQPVLRAMEVEKNVKEPDGEPVENLVAIASNLRGVRCRIESLNKRLNDVLERCEL